MLRDRARQLNGGVAATGDYVLYWAQMNRRADANHALEFAAAMANDLGLPLVCYEALTCSYPHASDRLHTFILEGVPEMRRRLTQRGIGYVFHLRRRRQDPNDALYRAAERAAAVVTDDYPAFITPRHNASVAAKLAVPFWAVDASCIVPMERIEKRQWAAYTIRPKIRRLLPRYLVPVEAVRLRRRFSGPLPIADTEVTTATIATLAASCEIDHTVPPCARFQGGRKAAETALARFLEDRLRRYAREKNEPSAHATSELSPYLHFGQIGALEVALAVQEHAREHKLIAEEFLEELIVRRELAFNFCRYTEDFQSLTALPDWARATLQEHAGDRRDSVYTRAEFEQAHTHDPLWNAAQEELLVDGRIHGYYRMYWGKKIIEWSATPEEALETAIYLNDRYALDGRDPNTYANILWCFGLHDRPWPERPVFGKVRWMSLEGMRRKTDVEAYIREGARR
ncbi:MAG TPA: deoxyribodipyrimidine photo-lyase [Bryobacteraceae bacterium]|nr:deoxyribodipyrimidine photo-lyase [Bryobacteraceae bacterium]